MLEWLRRTRSAGPSASRRAALQPALPHSKEGTEESGDEGPAASREVRALRAIATLVTATARLVWLVVLLHHIRLKPQYYCQALFDKISTGEKENVFTLWKVGPSTKKIILQHHTGS